MIKFDSVNEQDFITYRDMWPTPLLRLASNEKLKHLVLSTSDMISIASFSRKFRLIHGLDSEVSISSALAKDVVEMTSNLEEAHSFFIGSPSWSKTLYGGREEIFRYQIQRSNILQSRYLNFLINTGKVAKLYVSNMWQTSETTADLFRIFIRDRRVIGVSQYFYKEIFSEIEENEAEIKACLVPFSRDLVEASHMDSVVADVFVESLDDGSFKSTLIELNPFSPQTDPCMFSWQNGGNFDGTFRYRKKI